MQLYHHTCCSLTKSKPLAAGFTLVINEAVSSWWRADPGARVEGGEPFLDQDSGLLVILTPHVIQPQMFGGLS